MEYISTLEIVSETYEDFKDAVNVVLKATRVRAEVWRGVRSYDKMDQGWYFATFRNIYHWRPVDKGVEILMRKISSILRYSGLALWVFDNSISPEYTDYMLTTPSGGIASGGSYEREEFEILKRMYSGDRFEIYCGHEKGSVEFWTKDCQPEPQLPYKRITKPARTRTHEQVIQDDYSYRKSEKAALLFKSFMENKKDLTPAYEQFRQQFKVIEADENLMNKPDPYYAGNGASVLYEEVPLGARLEEAKNFTFYGKIFYIHAGNYYIGDSITIDPKMKDLLLLYEDDLRTAIARRGGIIDDYDSDKLKYTDCCVMIDSEKHYNSSGFKGKYADAVSNYGVELISRIAVWYAIIHTPELSMKERKALCDGTFYLDTIERKNNSVTGADAQKTRILEQQEEKDFQKIVGTLMNKYRNPKAASLKQIKEEVNLNSIENLSGFWSWNSLEKYIKTMHGTTPAEYLRNEGIIEGKSGEKRKVSDDNRAGQGRNLQRAKGTDTDVIPEYRKEKTVLLQKDISGVNPNLDIKPEKRTQTQKPVIIRKFSIVPPNGWIIRKVSGSDSENAFEIIESERIIGTVPLRNTESLKNIVFIGLRGNNKVIETVARDDSRAKIIYFFFLAGDGSTSARIDLIEKKKKDLRTSIYLEPELDIDLSTASPRLREHDFSHGHPMGEKWEQFWQKVALLVCSIAFSEDDNTDFAKGDKVSLSHGISFILPENMKCIKKDGNANVSIYTNGGDIANAEYSIWIHEPVIGKQFRYPGRNEKIKLEINARSLLYEDYSPFSSIIREEHFNGYYFTETFVLGPEPRIHGLLLNAEGLCFEYDVASNNGAGMNRLFSLSNAIFESLSIRGKAENTPLTINKSENNNKEKKDRESKPDAKKEITKESTPFKDKESILAETVDNVLNTTNEDRNTVTLLANLTYAVASFTIEDIKKDVMEYSKQTDGNKAVILRTATKTDYLNEALFEAALNRGEKTEGKIVRFKVLDIKNPSAFGFNLWAGEHLNFVTGTSFPVKVGDFILARVHKVRKHNTSWIIIYDRIELRTDRSNLSNPPVRANVIASNSYSSAIQTNEIKASQNIIIKEGTLIVQEKEYANSDIQSIVFPKSVKTISNFAFASCKELQLVVLTEGLTKIGAYAFDNCPMLQEIRLPDSIIDIDAKAFTDISGGTGGSHITVVLSRTTAYRLATSRKSSDYPIFARAFRIYGKEYSSLKQFADEFEKKVQATAAYYSKTEAGNTQKPSSATLSATNERVKSNEKTFQSDPSDTRDDEKNRIKNQIAALYVELSSQKGLFAGIRRKKIQAQIDELQEKLASIKKNIG